MFSTFPSCSQMPVLFYHSVIHGLGFSHLLYDIDFTCSVLYSDEAWVFDQSERAQGPIYVINCLITVTSTRIFKYLSKQIEIGIYRTCFRVMLHESLFNATCKIRAVLYRCFNRFRNLRHVSAKVPPCQTRL